MTLCLPATPKLSEIPAAAAAAAAVSIYLAHFYLIVSLYTIKCCMFKLYVLNCVYSKLLMLEMSESVIICNCFFNNN